MNRGKAGKNYFNSLWWSCRYVFSMSRVLPDHQFPGDKLMPINQSWVRFPAAANKTFSVSSGRCLDHGELGPAQTTNLSSGFIEGIHYWYSINISKDWKGESKLSLCPLYSTFSFVLQIDWWKDSAKLRSCESGSSPWSWQKAATGKGFHLAAQLAASPGPGFADTLCQLPRFAGYSLSWLGQRF